MEREPNSEYVKTIRHTDPMSGDEPIEIELTEKAKIIYRNLLF